MYSEEMPVVELQYTVTQQQASQTPIPPSPIMNLKIATAAAQSFEPAIVDLEVSPLDEPSRLLQDDDATVVGEQDPALPAETTPTLQKSYSSSIDSGSEDSYDPSEPVSPTKSEDAGPSDAYSGYDPDVAIARLLTAIPSDDIDKESNKEEGEQIAEARSDDLMDGLTKSFGGFSLGEEKDDSKVPDESNAGLSQLRGMECLVVSQNKVQKGENKSNFGFLKSSHMKRKAAYRLSAVNSDSNQLAYGTAIYIGRGLFLTAAHNLRDFSTTGNMRLTLDHGEGSKSGFGGLTLLHAQPVAYMKPSGEKLTPGKFISNTELQRVLPNGSKLRPENALDIAVISLQPGQNAPPDSEALEPHPNPFDGKSDFPAKFWGCNSATKQQISVLWKDYYRYTSDFPNEKALGKFIKSNLLPEQCSRAKGKNTQFVTVDGTPAPATSPEALFVKHRINTLNGASGSAITKKFDNVGKDGKTEEHDGIIGIHVKATYDFYSGSGYVENPVEGGEYKIETNNYAVNIHNPAVKKFLYEAFAEAKKANTSLDLTDWVWKKFASDFTLPPLSHPGSFELAVKEELTHYH